MRSDTTDTSGQLSVRERRRQVARMLGGSLVVSMVVTFGYYVLPMTSALAADSLIELTFGLMIIALLLTWQIRDITQSSYPGARALSALLVTVPLFLVLFATAYFVMGQTDASNFSEPMTRLDSMYFTITTFATVGFGDITAVSEPARAVTTLQMVGDLVLVGLIARVVFGAVQEARSRQGGRPR